MLYFSKKVLYFPKKVLYFTVFLCKIWVRPLVLWSVFAVKYTTVHAVTSLHNITKLCGPLWKCTKTFTFTAIRLYKYTFYLMMWIITFDMGSCMAKHQFLHQPEVAGSEQLPPESQFGTSTPIGSGSVSFRTTSAKITFRSCNKQY